MGTVSSRETINRRKIPSLRSQRKSIISDSGISNTIVNPVKLVKHQVVLSDHIPPMSSLSAAISPISWRKSSHSTVSNISTDDDDISPRTSTGSDHHGFLKINTLYDTYSDPNIIFESKYHLNQQQRNERKPTNHQFYHNDEKEYDRQLRQHYVLKQIMKGNIHVPMSGTDTITILNSACGAGLWAMDIAQEYPHPKVIALDIFNNNNNNLAPSTTPNGEVVIDKKPTRNNVIYKNGHITTEWDIPDNSIDVIYQRDAIDKIPKSEWPRLLEQFKRVAKQGAYLELVEYKFVISDPGPALALMNEWHNIISGSIGVDPNQADYLEPLLRDCGFADIQIKKIIIPVGEWPTDKGEREKGFLYKQVIQTMFKSMKSTWVSELGITDAEFTKVTNAALSEFEEQHASVEWVITTARNPM